MKTQDLISVVSIAIVGTLLAYFAMNAVLGDPLDKMISFDYLDFDAGQFATPDAEMFNSAAINPTVDVYVGTCVDINHNGLLEDFEKVACGQAVETQTNEVTTSGESETEDEESSTENLDSSAESLDSSTEVSESEGGTSTENSGQNTRSN